MHATRGAALLLPVMRPAGVYESSRAPLYACVWLLLPFARLRCDDANLA